MARKLPTTTVKELQTLLTRIGSATSGKRSLLLSRLSRNLMRPRMPTCADHKNATRILSIDMGIKNLAFCVADVKRGTQERTGGSAEMSIAAWRRLDVNEEMARSKEHGEVEPRVDEGEGEDLYTPSALSHTAYALLTQTLLPYDPDIILIERQRWRSSGGPSIQQWTVRVNTLEGMLWAVLIALRSDAGTQAKQSASPASVYEIFSVDPKRVGAFWIGENARAHSSNAAKKREEDELLVGPDGEVGEVLPAHGSAVKKASRGKAEKQAKIQLLRSWLASDARSPATSIQNSPAIRFTFSPDAEATREAVCATGKAKGGRKGAEHDGPALKKLDDVTDCFLQAAAWVAWEANRTKIVQDWDAEEGRQRSQSTAPA